MYFVFFLFFFFKQKTEYEMRISYWSSDVCSSVLAAPLVAVADEAVVERGVDIRRFAFGHACEHAPDLLGQRRRHGTKTCGTGFDHGRVDGKTLEDRKSTRLNSSH